jgi:hypothetical protein
VTYIPEARPRRIRPINAARIHAARGRSDLGGVAVAAAPGGCPEVEERLAAARTSRAHRQSRLRALLNQRNEAIGAALMGRVPAAAIAAATGLKLTEIRKIGRAYADSYAPDLSGLVEELRAIEDEKESAERQLRADVVDVLRSGKMDVFRIAALTAVTAERLRELTRGTGLRAEKFQG